MPTKTKPVLKSIYTVDAGEVKVIETGEGFLKAEVSIARAGVFPYISDGDVVYKAKLPEDLFSEGTLDSARGAPVTEEHPLEDGRYILLDSENAKFYAKGNVSEPRVVGDKLVALETLYDKELIDKILRGEKREVSIGFTFDEEPKVGSYNGQGYQAVQRSIEINHVAHVDKGRAGSEVRIHVDKEDATMSGEIKDLLTWRTLEDKDIQVDASAHAELKALKAKVADLAEAKEKAEKDLKELTDKAKDKGKDSADSKLAGKVEELEGKLQTANDKAEALKGELKKAQDEMPGLVEEAAKLRKELEQDAESAGIVTDGLSDNEIKLQVIGKHLPFKEGISQDALEQSIIDARYDAAMDLLRTKENKSGADKAPRTSGLDEEAIAEKRTALQNRYNRDKQDEAAKGGK